MTFGAPEKLVRSRRLLWAVVIVGVLFSANAAKADFIQVTTSFGQQSALLDKSTGVEWLHWNFTNYYSYNDMKLQLAPGGRFDGWRYATPEELKQFFIDYTGSPNGIVLGNDALAMQFMNDLGGPLFITTNPANGFHRESGAAMLDVPWDLGHAIYGYVAIDNFSGAKITPNLQGSSRDWFGTSMYGHWLVKEEPASVPEPSTLIMLASAVGLIAWRKKS